MPRYYFDISEDGRLARDTDGIDLPDVKTAADEAVRVLPNVARDAPSDSDRHAIVARVRDESGRVVFQATLSLVSEWLD